MTDSERDSIIEMLVTTLGQISANVEKLAAEWKRIIEKQEQVREAADSVPRAVQRQFPVVTPMSCDHDATRRNFEAFIAGTKLIGGMPDGSDGWMLLGVCTRCDSTLAIPIADPRGTAVKGEIGARPRSLAGETGMTLEEHAAISGEADELAKRFIK